MEEGSWVPIDLVALAATPPQPPEIAGLFYVGKRHTLVGESEALKSWLLLAATVAELRAGPWRRLGRRRPRRAERRARTAPCPRRDRRHDPLLVRLLRPGGAAARPARPRRPAPRGRRAPGRARRVQPAAVPARVRPGQGRRDRGVHAEVANPLRMPARRWSWPTTCEGARGAGNWAIGSERKKSAVEVQIGMKLVEPFGRGRVGKAKLMSTRIAPDFSTGQPGPARALIRQDTGRVAWRVEPDDGTPTMAASARRC